MQSVRTISIAMSPPRTATKRQQQQQQLRRPRQTNGREDAEGRTPSRLVAVRRDHRACGHEAARCLRRGRERDNGSITMRTGDDDVVPKWVVSLPMPASQRRRRERDSRAMGLRRR
jgi:hypothetical protein